MGSGGSHTHTIEYRTDPALLAKVNELQKQISEVTNELTTEKNKRIDDLNTVLKQKDETLKALQDQMTEKLEEIKDANEKKQNELKKELSELRNEYQDTIQDLTIQDLIKTLKSLVNIRNELQVVYENNLENLFKNQITYDQLECNIKYEENKLIKFENEINDTDILQLLLYSPTGHGKSTFANRLFGDTSPEGNTGPFKVSHNVTSETQIIQKGFIRHLWDLPISIIDTPGLYDSDGNLQDREHNNNIIEYLRGCNGINAFLLLKSCSDPRLDYTYLQMLTSLSKQISSESDNIDFWEHVIMVITKADGYNQRKCNGRYTEDLVNFIKREFDLEIDIPIITMSSMDNFQEPLYKLVNQMVPTSRFYSVSLHSPLQQLKTEKLNIKFELDKYQSMNDTVITKITELILALHDTIDTLDEKKSDYQFDINSKNDDWRMYHKINEMFDNKTINKYVNSELRLCENMHFEFDMASDVNHSTCDVNRVYINDDPKPVRTLEAVSEVVSNFLAKFMINDEPGIDNEQNHKLLTGDLYVKCWCIDDGQNHIENKFCCASVDGSVTLSNFYNFCIVFFVLFCILKP